MRLPLTAFSTCRTASVDLYCDSGGKQPTLYRARRSAITAEDLQDLSRRGHVWLYVSARDFANLDSHLLQSLQENLVHYNVPYEQQFATLQAAASLEVTRSMQMIHCSHLITLTDLLGKRISSVLGDRQASPRRLFDAVPHDSSSYTHATNVAAYVVILSDRLGVATPSERVEICVAALLHDLGKRFIPQEVLAKKGRLTSEDWELLHSHPQRGYEELVINSQFSHGQLMMVYQHHEQLQGGGYPVGITGEEIHPWARMLSIVDAFDALTGRRPYRQAMTPAQALEQINQQAGSHFDQEMTKCWISAFRQN